MTKRPKYYEVFQTALGKFTATTNPRSERAASRHYKVFDTRIEAQTWADKQNKTQEETASSPNRAINAEPR